MIRSDGRFVQTRGYCTDIFFREAETWITKCKEKDTPFFCYLSTNAPHGPLIPPASGDDHYRKALQEAGLKNAKQIDRVAPFYAMVENIDTNMGRLLRTIDSLGLADNTLIVFSTDNGSAAGSSFYNAEMHGSKNSPYRGGTRVPAFWKWKGVLPEGVNVPQVTAHIDVLPTLCELAGVKVPEAVDTKIAKLRKLGPALVVLTNGSSGVQAWKPEGDLIFVDTLKVDVVDTVGAGDSFNAGFLTSLSKAGLLNKTAIRSILESDIVAALNFGVRAASITVGRAGANPPWRDEI